MHFQPQLLKLPRSKITFESRILNPVEVLLHNVVDLRQSFNSNVVSNNYVHIFRLPLAFESLVLPFSKKMPDKLECFYPNQPVIRNMPLEPCMMKGHGQSLLIFLEKYSPAFVVKIAGVEFKCKVLVRLYDSIVDQIEDRPVHDDWFEYLCEIQGKRKPPFAWFVQVGNRRMKLRVVDL